MSRDLTKVRKLLGEIIAVSDDPAVDALAGEALQAIKDDDARELRKKPSKRAR